jgi:hypothetical protein
MEHAIPAGGMLTVQIPKQTSFIGYTNTSDPATFFSHTNGLLQAPMMNSTAVTLTLPKGLPAQEPVTFSLLNVRTPRSFKTSQTFILSTMGSDGYVIDAGGKEIALTMNQMTPLSSIQIVPSSLVNGAIEPYKVSFITIVELRDLDVIQIRLPTELSLA